MIKRICLGILATILLCTTVYAIDIANMQTIYDLHTDHISLAKANVTISGVQSKLTFQKSLDLLNAQLVDDTLSAGSTQIYYEPSNLTDEENNILRVDIDFASKSISNPVNVIFVMDQSGSMNMVSGAKSVSTFTSPCMNPNHFYRFIVQIDGKDYAYYFNAQHSNATSTWSTSVSASGILNDLKSVAATVDETKGATSFVVPEERSGVFAPELHHYAMMDSYDIDTVKRLFPLSSTENSFSSEEAIYYKQLLEEVMVTSSKKETVKLLEINGINGDFYSPQVIDFSIGDSTAIFENYIENDMCYDRMTVSKIIFSELSEDIRNANGLNQVGYVNFAIKTYVESPLSTAALPVGFLDTLGYYGTNWGAGLTSADKLFDPITDGQNVIVFVTDGTPTVAPTSKAGVEAAADVVINENNALMFYVGIDLPQTVMETFEYALSTDNSKGEPHAYNAATLEELAGIQQLLTEILTAQTSVDTQIEDLFKLYIDDTHPIELTYIKSGDTTITTETITDVNQFANYGIVYNEDTKELSWNVHQSGISHARLSFYKQIDYNSVQWDIISSGGIQNGPSLKQTDIGFIDYKGTPNSLAVNASALATIQDYSQLTITNTTSTPQVPNFVDVNGDIHYTITVTNEGTIDAENLIVRQEIPDQTTFKESDLATYDAMQNELIYEIPLLPANQSVSFTYVTTADVPNVTISSAAQLGVSDKAHTLDAESHPILSAAYLHHQTADILVVAPLPEVSPTEPEVGNSVGSSVENTTEITYENNGVETPDIPNTRDESRLIEYLLVMLICLLGMLAILLRYSANNKKNFKM